MPELQPFTFHQKLVTHPVHYILYRDRVFPWQHLFRLFLFCCTFNTLLDFELLFLIKTLIKLRRMQGNSYSMFSFGITQLLGYSDLLYLRVGGILNFSVDWIKIPSKYVQSIQTGLQTNYKYHKTWCRLHYSIEPLTWLRSFRVNILD